MGVVTSFSVDASHPALAGHFPGTPIVPGVLLLDETLRAAERGSPHGRWRIGSAKFLKPVGPGEPLTLEQEPLPDGSIRFAVSSAGQLVARGLLRPIGMARNAPEPPAPATALQGQPRTSGPAPRASGSLWTGERERGSALLLRVMIGLSLGLGRPVARCLLYSIAAYFFLFAPTARRHSREYLRRALGREPTGRDRFRQVFGFAATILDRLYFIRERYALFEISIEGEELMRAALAAGSGAFLFGAHLGSFQLMSTVGRQQPGLKVAMAMYAHNASKLTAMYGVGNPQTAPEIIPLGHLEAMLRIHECLDAGGFVGMLADRTMGEAPAEPVSFLGRPALFPSGPMRAAAALRRPVFFMTGLYRGGNRYHVVFRRIADFSAVTRGGRDAAVRAGIRTYAAVLEEYCRSDPYNWFNFYDFWHESPAGGAPQ